MMHGMDIETIWERIERYEGETFHTITGIPFEYEVMLDDRHGNERIQPIPHNGSKIFPITKETMEQCLYLMPLKNTTPLQKFKAPSYIFAILTDKRIV